MVKKTRGQEVKENIHRLERRQEKDKPYFPECIGLFPDDCLGVTSAKIGIKCKRCPYFDAKQHKKEIKKVIEMAEIKQLSPEQFEAHLKDVLSEEDFTAWKSKNATTPSEKTVEGEKTTKASTPIEDLCYKFYEFLGQKHKLSFKELRRLNTHVYKRLTEEAHKE